jgi:predicted nuclease with RNAse H fold
LAGVRVLGIDLAAQPASTGAVLLEPVAPGRWCASVAAPEPDDDTLVRLAATADRVGVDAPLGWPEPFVDAVAAHQRHDPWPAAADRRPLTHRRTDDVVVEMGWGRPMSASADRLGSVAMRAALLQREWAGVWGAAAPRDGSGRLAETYPAAALRVWDVPCRGYKASGARAAQAAEVRAGVVEHLATATGPWLDLSPLGAAPVQSDHVLDALVCALVVCAIAEGHTLGPRDPEEARRALLEGWIHVPTVPLGDLRTGPAV